MAQIRFGNYSRGYEQFHLIFHIACGAVCVIMTGAAIFSNNGFVYFPAVFFICSLLNFVNAYDIQRGIRKNKRKTSSIMYVIFGILSLLAAVFSAVCFWT